MKTQKTTPTQVKNFEYNKVYLHKYRKENLEQNLMRERNTNICISNQQVKNRFIQIISVYEKTKKKVVNL